MRDDDEIIALLYQRDEQVLDLLHKQYGALCFQIAYRQHRTELVVQMRSQIFRQIV